MTEREAWLLIAEAWDSPITDAYALNPWDRCYDDGICDSIDGTPLEELHYEMNESLEIFGDTGDYLWPRTEAGAVQRTWACLFLAAMAEDG
jgi:hypothetical protein